MAKMKSNKLITNFPVPLSDVENQNLSLTLSGVVTRNGLWRPSVTAGGDISWEYDDSNSRVPPTSQNIKGPEGKAPFLKVNPENSHLLWSRDGLSHWQDTEQTTSGAVGPQGPQGIQGIQGPAGPEGDPGHDGVSPSVSTSVINPDTSHPKGGTEVTIIDSDGQHKFEIWNGADGAGATVALLAGSGIWVHADGTNYTISVSADYALRSELPDVSQYATQTWVEQQGYLKDSALSDYATKSYANDASANALSQAKSWVETQHYLTSVPESYATKTYANDTSANVKSWVESEKYLKAVAQNLSLSGDGTTEHPLGIDEAGMAANNLYGWNYSTHTWSAIPSSVTQVEHDNTLSGNGTSSSKLGIDGAMVTRWNAASALSATKLDKTVWDETSGSFLQAVETNNSVSGDGSTNRPIGLNGEVLSQLSKIDYKSSVTSGAGNVFTVNDGTNSNPAKNFTFSAVNYKSGQTAGYVPQQLFVVASDNEIISLVNGGAADGKGCLFFRVQ